MTQEEKAKRYGEALHKAKNYYSTTDSSSDIKLIGLIFPELKESDDNRIRKALIRFHKSTIDIDGIKGEDILAWLEKQGEKSSDKIVEKARTEKQRVLLTETDGSANIDWDCRSLQDVKLLLEYGLDYIKKLEKQSEQKSADSYCRENCKGFQETGKCFADGDCKAKQEQIKKNLQDNSFRRMFEQKPADKVEPKFNVHDCIIKKHNSDIHDFGSFIITDITGGKYWYNDRIICDISEQDEWEIYKPARQTSTEWSEEDEKYIKDLTDYFTGGMSLKHTEEDIIAWLKSLRPQSTWKPSDEQMNNK